MSLYDTCDVINVELLLFTVIQTNVFSSDQPLDGVAITMEEETFADLDEVFGRRRSRDVCRCVVCCRLRGIAR